jgi:hypothetical protein
LGGWEDSDLKCRYDAAGIAFTRRKGSFQPLDHDHNGYNLDFTPKPSAIANERHFKERWASPAAQTDGITTLGFDILDRCPVPEGPVVERPAIWEHVKVRLKMKPTESAS